MKRDFSTQTTLLLAAAILVVVNLIGLNVFGRLDLTDDRVYSLSNASKEIVENLEDPIAITAFFSADLPAQFASNRRFLKDKLDDYRAYGGQNVAYQFVDPGEDEELRGEAGRLGIPPIQIQVIESDNVQLKNAYMGVAIEYENNRETIPVVEDLSSLEYDLTSAIRRLTREEKPIAGFWTDHGEPNPMQDMPTLQQNLSTNYEVQIVTDADLQGATPPDVLLIVAPTDTIPDSHLQALDSYIMDGGRVGFLLNRVAANLQAGQASELDIGIDPLLATYGIVLSPNLIMDEESSVVTVQQRQGFFNISQQMQYPLFPVATRFNSDNQMVSRLQNLMFYFVSSVDTSAILPDGVIRESLIYSSPQSGLQQGFFMLQPTQTTATLSGGPYVLGATFTGSFPSAYTPGRTSVPTRLVVVGDGDFINESILPPSGGNAQFGLNLVDWLAQDDALLSIRSKSIAPRTLRDVSEGMRPVIKYGNMIGPLLIVVLFGLLRWRKRRSRQIVVL
ncbi:MAG: GldG family protein [Bacteroidetes bacterium]|nr:GldG family protein [Bacteroidota bacterium]